MCNKIIFHLFQLNHTSLIQLNQSKINGFINDFEQQAKSTKQMRKTYTNNDRVIFKIDVKIGPRILTLNVCEGDTIVGLLVKNGIALEGEVERLKELKDKIVLNIQKQIQIKLYSNQLDLAKRMEGFLNKQVQKLQPPTKPNQQQQQQHQGANNNDKSHQPSPHQTPFKMLFERTQTFSNINHNLAGRSSSSISHSAQNSQTKNRNSSFALSRESIAMGPIMQINHLKPKQHHVGLSNSKKNNQYSRGEQSNQKASRRKVDEDLIKAYEIILKKSKDKAMREMAERTLKELNVNVHDSDGITTQQFQLPPQEKQPPPKPTDPKQTQNPSKPKPSTLQQFTQCRQQMRRATKYSYLQSAISLNHEYEKQNVKDDKGFMGKDEVLKKPYVAIKSIDEIRNSSDRFSHHHHHAAGGGRRYNYLFD